MEKGQKITEKEQKRLYKIRERKLVKKILY